MGPSSPFYKLPRREMLVSMKGDTPTLWAPQPPSPLKTMRLLPTKRHELIYMMCLCQKRDSAQTDSLSCWAHQRCDVPFLGALVVSHSILGVSSLHATCHACNVWHLLPGRIVCIKQTSIVNSSKRISF